MMNGLVVADRSDPRRQVCENASLPSRQQGHEVLVNECEADRVDRKKVAIAAGSSALLSRTTRLVTPTEVGAAYFGRVQGVPDELASAIREASDHAASPQGLVPVLI